MTPEAGRDRILLLTSNFPRWRGDSTTPFVLHVAQDLQSQGWTVTVVAPHAPGAATRETIDGVAVRRFRYLLPATQETVCYGGGALVNLRGRRTNALKLPFLVLAEWLTLNVELLRRRYALVHAHWVLPQGFVAALRLRRRVPVVITVHGGDIFGLQSRPLARAKRWALQAASAVTVNSGATRDAVERIAGGLADLRVVPIGTAVEPADAATVERVRDRHRTGKGPLLAFVGRLVDEKGVDDLLQAVAALVPDRPDVRAVIVGEGQDRGALEHRAHALGVDAHVDFTGWVQPRDVGAYLAAADVFVAPSRTGTDGWIEGQGLTIIEAMMAGTPVVATRSGGIVDSVEHGVTGLLVDERAPQQIAAAVRLLLDDPAAAHRMAAAARSSAEARFGRTESAERFSALFEALLARPVGGG